MSARKGLRFECWMPEGEGEEGRAEQWLSRAV